MIDLKAFGEKVEVDEDIKKMVDDFNKLRKRIIIGCGTIIVAMVIVTIIVVL